MDNHPDALADENGSIIVSILVVTIFLSTFVFSLLVLANSNLTRARNRIFLLQSQYAAESGADSAIAVLNSGNTTYSGTTSEVAVLEANSYRATYTVSVVNGVDDKERLITAVGRVYAPKTSATAAFTRTIEVVSQRSSSTTTSAVLSRNIIEIDSNVKNLKARDIYVNGYISLNKPSTNLVAENITIADKKTGAGNCSLGGDGELLKPTSFSDPGQTRTRLILAYNNCLTPPGNTSNSDFEVLANQINVSKIQSTHIPYSHYMDNTYQNAAGGCSDWTSGSSPRSIPSTGNTKKTHYPDPGTGITASCGTSGSLALGSAQFNIEDHVHVRANLCSASACSPTFYNPDSSVKYVFVEGTVNFDAVQTASGSGPIVFVVYGTDPAAKASLCPLGGAVYLGNNGTTIAPDAYFIATNGVCLDKTRFGATPALGGFSGKNVYVSTNSGSPHDLSLDVSFPTAEVPVDLAWRSVRFRRL